LSNFANDNHNISKPFQLFFSSVLMFLDSLVSLLFCLVAVGIVAAS